MTEKLNRAQRRKNRSDFKRVYKRLRAGKKIAAQDKPIARYLIEKFSDKKELPTETVIESIPDSE